MVTVPSGEACSDNYNSTGLSPTLLLLLDQRENQRKMGKDRVTDSKRTLVPPLYHCISHINNWVIIGKAYDFIS